MINVDVQPSLYPHWKNCQALYALGNPSISSGNFFANYRIPPMILTEVKEIYTLTIAGDKIMGLTVYGPHMELVWDNLCPICRSYDI